MAEAVRAGVHRRTLYALRDAGELEQLGRGLCRLADAPPLAHPDLVSVARRVPRGAVCLVSALAFHDLTTQVPHEVYLAAPAAWSRPGSTTRRSACTATSGSSSACWASESARLYARD